MSTPGHGRSRQQKSLSSGRGQAGAEQTRRGYSEPTNTIDIETVTETARNLLDESAEFGTSSATEGLTRQHLY